MTIDTRNAPKSMHPMHPLPMHPIPPIVILSAAKNLSSSEWPTSYSPVSNPRDDNPVVPSEVEGPLDERALLEGWTRRHEVVV